MRPFLIALQFLTRLPVPVTANLQAEELGKSVLYYPLVGLVIGFVLLILTTVLNNQPAMLVAALLLTVWVLITGGLHLDGLADSADAWAGGHGDSERTLEIMKDPRSGPLAIVVLVLLLLVKFSALFVLLEQQLASLLLISPVLARAAVPLLFLNTDYVRQNGLGAEMARHLPENRVYVVAIVAFCILPLLVDLQSAAVVVLMFVAVFYLLRRLMIKTIAGMTGDTIGALIEIMEAAVLVALVL
ncbi:MAG: adenosylcobinamide-GDP ribazoletransferase [Gammaproteobacteria bacterium]|nr:adenosylcobinamide-GDP ribazoletransferase [Gammaproteobacteria bacterium]